MVSDLTTSTAASICNPWPNGSWGNHAAKDDATATIKPDEYAAAATATATTAAVRSNVKGTTWLIS